MGGILAGVGTAGAIASAAALIKVGAAGIVSALAGLVGAAAAPWVAIAIPAVSVALTVTGIYLLATKPDNKDLKKIHNNVIQAKKDLSTKIKELDKNKNKLEKLKTEAVASKEREGIFEKKEISDESIKNNSNQALFLMNELEKVQKDDEIQNEISELNKNMSDLEKEIKNLRVQIAKWELILHTAAKNEANNLEKEKGKFSTFEKVMLEDASQIVAILNNKREKNNINNSNEIKHETEDIQKLKEGNSDVSGTNNTTDDKNRKEEEINNEDGNMNNNDNKK